MRNTACTSGVSSRHRTPSKWFTAMTFVVAVDHSNGGSEESYVRNMHRSKGSYRMRLYFLVEPICSAHFPGSMSAASNLAMRWGDGRFDNVNDHQTRHRLRNLIGEAFGFPKSQNLPRLEPCSSSNAKFLAEVQKCHKLPKVKRRIEKLENTNKSSTSCTCEELEPYKSKSRFYWLNQKRVPPAFEPCITCLVWFMITSWTIKVLSEIQSVGFWFFRAHICADNRITVNIQWCDVISKQMCSLRDY